MPILGPNSGGGYTDAKCLRFVYHTTLHNRACCADPEDGAQVDLIVCYDASASPIRNIQRMGRTGRHRQGRVVCILAAGVEQQNYHKNLAVRALAHAYKGLDQRSSGCCADLMQQPCCSSLDWARGVCQQETSVLKG